jgi:hypothetical protein
MDTSTVKPKIVFGLLACALMALGAYLLGPAFAARSQRPAAADRPVPSSARPGARSSHRLQPAQPAQPAPAPSGSQVPEIYRWLPFTPAGLSAAASVVVRFGDVYGTFSYAQNATTYARSLQALALPVLAEQIRAAYSAPGVAAARISGRQVSVGTATIESIRAFGPSSLTFVVRIAARMTDRTGRTIVTTSYAITVTGSRTAWFVSDIELASAGNS